MPETKGIAAVPLPAGSFDVEKLDKALSGTGGDPTKIEEALAKQQEPVAVNYQDKPVDVDFARAAVPPGHELKEIKGIDGERREQFVPVPAEAKKPAEGEDAFGGAAAPLPDAAAAAAESTGKS